MIDEGTDFGARVARRLREEIVVWLTTVTPAGAPLPRPVGFLWDGGEVVSMYSMAGARVRNIGANPRVTLNFDGDGLVRRALQRPCPDPADGRQRTLKTRRRALDRLVDMRAQGAYDPRCAWLTLTSP